VTHVDGEVDLLAFNDLKLAFVLLHVDSDELIADLWSVLSGINEAEFILFEGIKLFSLSFAIAFSSLLPANLIKTLAEEDDKRQDRPVEPIVDLLTHCEKVECEDLIDMHA